MPEFSIKMRFYLKVLKRMATILPRRNKKIKMFYIDYVHPAENGSQVMIKYRFRNALWYTIDNKDITCNRVMVTKNDTVKEVSLIVHGFFRKNIYTLLLEPEYIHVIKIMHL